MQNDKLKIKTEFRNRLYNFNLELIKFLDKLPNDNVSRRISDQVLRSGTSILANYVEGQSASSKKDFTNFLNHSLKSTNESKIWLELLSDTNRAKKDETGPFLKELGEVGNILGASILTLRGRNKI